MLLIEAAPDSMVTALAALAQSTRLAIFRHLVVTGQAGLSPSQLCEHLEIAPSALSFHLKELLHANLVSQERAGRSLIYRAEYAQMNALIGYLSDNCCKGAACGVEVSRCSPSP